MLTSLLRGKPLRHPLHPILIHFPIGLFVLSLVLDFLSLALDEAGVYLEASLYVLTAGVAAALLAVVPGLADYLGIRRDSPARRIGTIHLLLNLTAVIIYAVNAWLRWTVWNDDAAAPGDRVAALAFLLSLVGLGLIAMAAYLGGRLIYGHGIAVGRHRRKAPLPKRTIQASSEGSPDGFARVADEAALSEGESLRAEVDGVVMTVLRLNGQYHAFQEFCTHRFGPLSEGCLHDGQIRCPWHRSDFDVGTGKVVSGPAKIDLLTHEVRVEGGEIRVRPRVQ